VDGDDVIRDAKLSHGMADEFELVHSVVQREKLGLFEHRRPVLGLVGG
jgi:hypothetical protein